VPQQQLPVRTLVAEMRIFSSDSIPQAQLSGLADVVVAADGCVFAFDNRVFPLPQAAQDPGATRALAALPSGTFGGQPGQVKLVLMSTNGIQSERIVNVDARPMTNAVRDAWIRTEFDYREAAIRASGRPRAALKSELHPRVCCVVEIPHNPWPGDAHV
jgi:hypothetical protein